MAKGNTKKKKIQKQPAQSKAAGPRPLISESELGRNFLELWHRLQKREGGARIDRGIGDLGPKSGASRYGMQVKTYNEIMRLKDSDKLTGATLDTLTEQQAESATVYQFYQPEKINEINDLDSQDIVFDTVYRHGNAGGEGIIQRALGVSDMAAAIKMLNSVKTGDRSLIDKIEVERTRKIFQERNKDLSGQLNRLLEFLPQPKGLAKATQEDEQLALDRAFGLMDLPSAPDRGEMKRAERSVRDAQTELSRARKEPKSMQRYQNIAVAKRKLDAAKEMLLQYTAKTNQRTKALILRKKVERQSKQQELLGIPKSKGKPGTHGTTDPSIVADRYLMEMAKIRNARREQRPGTEDAAPPQSSNAPGVNALGTSRHLESKGSGITDQHLVVAATLLAPNEVS